MALPRAAGREGPCWCGRQADAPSLQAGVAPKGDNIEEGF